MSNLGKVTELQLQKEKATRLPADLKDAKWDVESYMVCLLELLKIKEWEHWWFSAACPASLVMDVLPLFPVIVKSISMATALMWLIDVFL